MPALTTSLNSSLGPAVCRVCLCGESSIPYLGNAPGEPLISPCLCKGTMGLYHRSCLEHWLSMSRTYCCEICKFNYQIGRRKRSFWSYLRTHWLGANQSRSLAADLACFLLLSPFTFGGAILCIEGVAEMIRDASETDDFGKIHEILLLGLLGLFLIFMLGYWVIITAVSYFNDFRKWQKKNMILYVIDQLEREETCCQSRSLPSESMRPLLIKKKLRKYFCCSSGTSREEDTIIPLQEGIFEINPQLIEPNVQATYGAEQVRVFSSATTSPVSVASNASQRPSLESNRSTSVLVGTPDQTLDGVPALSTFRPHYTVASAQMLASTPKKGSSLPLFKQLNDEAMECFGATDLHTSTDDGVDA